MKLIIFFVIIILQSSKIFSQNVTPYGDFIETDTAIKWAAGADKILNLTPKTSRFSIKNKLLNTLNNEGLSVYIIDTNNQKVTKEFATKSNYKKFQSIFNIEDKYKAKPMFNRGDLSSILDGVEKYKNNYSDSEKLKSKIDYFAVKQILFYKNGKINISNVSISPIMFGKGESDDYILSGKCLFNSCFNNSSDENTSTKNLQYIGNLNVEYKFNYETEFRENNTQIITLREPNLIYQIMDDFQSGIFDVIDIKTNTKVPKGEFLSYKMPRDTSDNSDCYAGHLRTFQVRQKTIHEDYLNTFKINQDIFWDSVGYKIISKVNEIEIIAPYLNRKHLAGLEIPLYRIVYKKSFIPHTNRDYLLKKLKVIEFSKYVK